ncbi:MAG: Holliday junction resolvase RuvX [Actinobacteria bacterium]|nr:Holliday junction resolvase RuvX [Actinomycetota bacterium]
MGIDVGAVRIGVALSEGTLALAHDTLAFDESAVGLLAGLAAEKNVGEIYVGLPLSLSGDHTKSTQMAANFARQLAAQTPAAVFVIDERLSTVSSQRLLREAGKSAKQAKSMIDAESARAILDFALDSPQSAIKIGDLDA